MSTVALSWRLSPSHFHAFLPPSSYAPSSGGRSLEGMIQNKQRVQMSDYTFQCITPCYVGARGEYGNSLGGCTGGTGASCFFCAQMKLHFWLRHWPSVGYTHQIAVKSVSADSLSRIPQGDVMGSLYSPPLSRYDAASGKGVFLELNWRLALWVVKKNEENK